ncbi:hypothetical protein LOTGIDRAFT_176791, partial [Lottia gigantea]
MGKSKIIERKVQESEMSSQTGDKRPIKEKNQILDKPKQTVVTSLSTSQEEDISIVHELKSTTQEEEISTQLKDEPEETDEPSVLYSSDIRKTPITRDNSPDRGKAPLGVSSAGKEISEPKKASSSRGTSKTSASRERSTTRRLPSEERRSLSKSKYPSKIISLKKGVVPSQVKSTEREKSESLQDKIGRSKIIERKVQENELSSQKGDKHLVKEEIQILDEPKETVAASLSTSQEEDISIVHELKSTTHGEEISTQLKDEPEEADEPSVPYSSDIRKTSLTRDNSPDRGKSPPRATSGAKEKSEPRTESASRRKSKASASRERSTTRRLPSEERRSLSKSKFPSKIISLKKGVVPSQVKSTERGKSESLQDKMARSKIMERKVQENELSSQTGDKHFVKEENQILDKPKETVVTSLSTSQEEDITIVHELKSTTQEEEISTQLKDEPEEADEPSVPYSSDISKMSLTGDFFHDRGKSPTQATSGAKEKSEPRTESASRRKSKTSASRERSTTRRLPSEERRSLSKSKYPSKIISLKKGVVPSQVKSTERGISESLQDKMGKSKIIERKVQESEMSSQTGDKRPIKEKNQILDKPKQTVVTSLSTLQEEDISIVHELKSTTQEEEISTQLKDEPEEADEPSVLYSSDIRKTSLTRDNSPDRGKSPPRATSGAKEKSEPRTESASRRKSKASASRERSTTRRLPSEERRSLSKSKFPSKIISLKKGVVPSQVKSTERGKSESLQDKMARSKIMERKVQENELSSQTGDKHFVKEENQILDKPKETVVTSLSTSQEEDISIVHELKSTTQEEEISTQLKDEPEEADEPSVPYSSDISKMSLTGDFFHDRGKSPTQATS